LRNRVEQFAQLGAQVAEVVLRTGRIELAQVMR
jgi:hypothetical protein